MIKKRKRDLERFYICYFKKEGDIVKKVTKIEKGHSRAEIIMKIADIIGTSEMVKDTYNPKTYRVGIKCIYPKKNNTEYHSKEEVFKHKMGIFNERSIYTV